MDISIRFTQPYTIRYGTGYTLAVIGSRVFRAIEHRRSDGQRDPQRSRYWINGRVVKHAKYKREYKESA